MYMYDWARPWFYHHYYGGGVFMGLILIVLVLVVIYFIYNERKTVTGDKETPETILKKEYAKGSISKEVYLEKLKDLKS
ncbi:MAG: SHOCT domain-containing protein [Candidatus Margulisbacteria bacterium]|nr:SHOCT domain-containing protein [Candidatus Margulisiibacteriota bacterium]